MSKSQFILTLSESRNIFALEQKAIALSFVKNVAFWAGVIHGLPGCGLTGYPFGFHRLVAMRQTPKCFYPQTNQGVFHANNNGDLPSGLLFVHKHW